MAAPTDETPVLDGPTIFCEMHLEAAAEMEIDAAMLED